MSWKNWVTKMTNLQFRVVGIHEDDHNASPFTGKTTSELLRSVDKVAHGAMPLLRERLVSELERVVALFLDV